MDAIRGSSRARISLALSIAAGLGLALWLWPAAALDPLQWQWLLEGDRAQHFLGWQFFRDEAWQWPPGRLWAYGEAMGSSIVFTDSIPLLAILLKPLSAVLPQPLQYAGPWLLACYGLTAAFAWRCGWLATGRAEAGLLLALFAVLSPMIALRGLAHFALAAQWIIWWSLALYLEPGPRVAWWQRGLCLAIAALAHAYLLFIALAVFAAEWLRRTWLLRQVRPLGALTAATAIALGLAVVMWLAGYFVVAEPGGGDRQYGQFGADLDAWWASLDGARFGPYRPPSLSRGLEGMHYLGAGIGLAAGNRRIGSAALAPTGRSRPAFACPAAAGGAGSGDDRVHPSARLRRPYRRGVAAGRCLAGVAVAVPRLGPDAVAGRHAVAAGRRGRCVPCAAGEACGRAGGRAVAAANRRPCRAVRRAAREPRRRRGETSAGRPRAAARLAILGRSRTALSAPRTGADAPRRAGVGSRSDGWPPATAGRSTPASSHARRGPHGRGEHAWLSESLGAGVLDPDTLYVLQQPSLLNLDALPPDAGLGRVDGWWVLAPGWFPRGGCCLARVADRDVVAARFHPHRRTGGHVAAHRRRHRVRAIGAWDDGWGGSRAALVFDAGRGGALRLQLDVPSAIAATQQLVIDLDGRRVTAAADARGRIALDLPFSRSGRHLLRIEAQRAWVPRESGGSDDARALAWRWVDATLVESR